MLNRRNVVLPSLILAVAVMLITGIAGYRQAMRNFETREWVLHNHEVRRHLSDVLSWSQDVWGSTRGFVITGDESHLAPFHRATGGLAKSLPELRRLAAADARQLDNVGALEGLVARRIELSRQQIDLRKTKGQDAAEQAVRGGEGNRVMDSIRAMVADIEQLEDRRFEARNDELRARNRSTLGLGIALTLLTGILAGGAVFFMLRDSGARQRELALTQAGREYAESIVNTVREPLLVLNADLRVRSANRAFYENFRLSPEQTEGKPLEGVAAGRWNLPALLNPLKEVLPQHSELQDLEIEADFPGSGRRHLLLNARRMFRVGNNTDTILLAIEDVTERERTMRELDRFFELSQDLLCIANKDGYFVRVNAAWEGTLGYKAEELVSAPYLDFVHPDDKEATIAEASKLTAGQDVIAFENRYRCRDGSYKWLLWSSAPSPDREWIYAVAHEVTERKQAEEALRKSHSDLHRKFEAATRASGQLLYQWNPATGAVSYGNPERLLGYTNGDLGSTVEGFLELLHPDDRLRFRAELERALESSGPFSLEYRLRRKDGSYIEVEDRGYFITGDEHGAREMVGFVADISQRKKLENQLRQAQKMEALGRLTGGIAHDFNNLLCVITGYSELLLELLAAEDPRRRHVQEIRDAGNRGAGLTRQLLAFSRRQVLEPRVVNLNDIVGHLGNMLQRLVGEDISLHSDLHPSLGMVRVDPGQIEQVIMNLVVNARDAMPNGGTVTIETAPVELDQESRGWPAGVVAGRYAMLAVTDTGHGMDEATQARIFEPFFTTKEKSRGTGLGLATVYGIVKQSGGYVWVYSEPGGGTTFKIYLPIVEAAAEPLHADSAKVAPVPARKTVLVAEDDEAVRELACAFLERGGYQVLQASSPAQALEIAGKHRDTIDLLLSDVVMPGMSGPALAERFASIHPEAKVLYVSGYTENAITRQGVLDPRVAFLEKPYTKDGLLRKIADVLGAPSV